MGALRRRARPARLRAGQAQAHAREDGLGAADGPPRALGGAAGVVEGGRFERFVLALLDVVVRAGRAADDLDRAPGERLYGAADQGDEARAVAARVDVDGDLGAGLGGFGVRVLVFGIGVVVPFGGVGGALGGWGGVCVLVGGLGPATLEGDVFAVEAPVLGGVGATDALGAKEGEAEEHGAAAGAAPLAGGGGAGLAAPEGKEGEGDEEDEGDDDREDDLDGGPACVGVESGPIEAVVATEAA
ncbi:hypothetical protein OF83DRAFT_1113647 [Amylostereum chailletii]|nr:hypothetical protein OF83DRAFT_1113647 [Amylostereum chailletii]